MSTEFRIIITNLDNLRIKRMNLKLVTFSNNICTMGKLYNGKELICHTFELPWVKNACNVSCIPAGEYHLKMVNSNKFGPSYEVKNVIGRSHILIHKGNTVDDTQGCIMPVTSFGIFDGKKVAGLSSGNAYEKMMALLGGDHHKLTIERH